MNCRLDGFFVVVCSLFTFVEQFWFVFLVNLFIRRRVKSLVFVVGSGKMSKKKPAKVSANEANDTIFEYMRTVCNAPLSKVHSVVFHQNVSLSSSKTGRTVPRTCLTTFMVQSA